MVALRTLSYKPVSVQCGELLTSVNGAVVNGSLAISVLNKLALYMWFRRDECLKEGRKGEDSVVSTSCRAFS